MPTLRLFANLREAAGTSSTQIDGTTVAKVIEAATERYGDAFRAGLATARIWVNGEPADESTPVGPADEIALIPPVSGGATATGLQATPNVLPLLLLVALLVAAWIPVQWFVIVAAGAVLAWTWDLFATAHGGTTPGLYPLFVAPVAAAGATYAWGIPGFAGGVALAIILATAWPVFDPGARSVRSTAIATSIALVAALAAGGLVLLKLMSTASVVAFLVVAVIGMFVSALAQIYGQAIQSIDPNVGALLGALLAGVGVGLVVDEIDLAAAMLAAVFAAAGLIAGRAFGAMVRTGTVVHTIRAPGRLTIVDGLVVAAPLFWLALWLFG